MELIFKNKTDFFDGDDKYKPYVVIYIPYHKEIHNCKISLEDYYNLKQYQDSKILLSKKGYQGYISCNIVKNKKYYGLMNAIYNSGYGPHITYINGDKKDLRRENIIISQSSQREKIQITSATPVLVSTCIKDDINQSFSELVKRVAKMKHTPIEEVKEYLESLRENGRLGYFKDYFFVPWKGNGE